MSIHDIYDVNKNKTGNKFILQANHMRTKDEYSLNVFVFVVKKNKVYLLKDDETSKFYSLSDILLEDESSIDAAKRVLFSNLSIDANVFELKIFSTIISANNIIDYWLYKVDDEFDLDDFANQNKKITFFDRDEFEKILERHEFDGVIDFDNLDLIFGPRNKVKRKKLIIKNNLY